LRSRRPGPTSGSAVNPTDISRRPGWTIAAALDGRAEAFGLERESGRKTIEEAVIDLITEADESPLITSEDA
jgi:hypothetical protein